MSTPEGCGGCGRCMGCMRLLLEARPHGEDGANKRIAELESRLRQFETREREAANQMRRRHGETIAQHVAQHQSDTKTITDLRLQLLDAEARIEAMHCNANASSATAAAACERLVKYEPVVKAARDLVHAYETKDDRAGEHATEALVAGVKALPSEAS